MLVVAFGWQWVTAGAVPQVQLESPESGKHLLEAEELLQTHRLLERDMALQAEKTRAISAAALRFADAEGRCMGGWLGHPPNG